MVPSLEVELSPPDGTGLLSGAADMAADLQQLFFFPELLGGRDECQETETGVTSRGPVVAG